MFVRGPTVFNSSRMYVLLNFQHSIGRVGLRTNVVSHKHENKQAWRVLMGSGTHCSGTFKLVGSNDLPGT